MSHPSHVPARPIRVLVADDSAFMRRLLADALTGHGFDVVGVAADGDQALEQCGRLRPDVLTLDLAMPGLDGIGVLRALRRDASPIRVVVVSAFSPAHGARAVDALAEGAVDLVAKPSPGHETATFADELGDKVRAAAAATSGISSAPVRPLPAAPRPSAPTVAAPRRRAATGTTRAVVIACSTGGPRALAELLPTLPGEVGEGIVIVQHMPAGFTGSLAARLDRTSRLTVREAADGDTIERSLALVAPGGKHLRLTGGRIAQLSDEEQIGGLRPRADLTIADAARLFGERLLLVVLTGMGKDGLAGARDVRRQGGRILVEAESTCTVYGMPRAIAEAGLADAELPLGELAAAIVEEAA